MPIFRDVVEQLEPSGISKVALDALGDPAVLPLWFGEGDLPTDGLICQAAKDSLDRGETFYMAPRGRSDLRAALHAYLERLYGITLDPERIAVPGAAMSAVSLAALMCLDGQSHGLVVSPHWPNIEGAMRLTGAQIDYLRLEDADGRWSLDLSALEAALRPSTRLVFVNSPSNPTGWVMPPAQQDALLDLARARGFVILADEVYHRTVFDGDVAPSFLQRARPDDPLIVVNGFSKAWAMTGWRMGWMIVPSGYGTQMSTLSVNFNTGAPVFIQPGGIAALTEGEDIVQRLRQQYAGGRRLVEEIVGSHARVQLEPIDGAFYAFPRIAGLRDSLTFAQALLRAEKVGVAPGYTFGPGNDDRIRLCFALGHGRLQEALERLVRFIDRY